MPYISIILIVGIFVCALTWLVKSARELKCKRDYLNCADKQLAIYGQWSTGTMAAPATQLALEQVNLSKKIYLNVALIPIFPYICHGAFLNR